MTTSMSNAADSLLAELEDGDGLFLTKIPGLIVMRATKPTKPQCILYRPALCLILQGEKEMAVADIRNTYREGQSVVITQDMPTLVTITEATPKRPFVGLGLELDSSGMREVIEKLTRSSSERGHDGFELFVEDTSGQIESCVMRLIQAASYPDALSILRQSIMREVYYWLLTGPNGDKIARQLSITGSARRIAAVVHHLRHSFTEPLKMELLAARANMSPSSFYEHFKTVTSVSPLQFQKQLRLTEARRLLLMGGVSVAEASSQVGYESSSQFSREYSRMFGLPPAKDTSFFYDNALR
jgi:AraC-like DNA-binding protein